MAAIDLTLGNNHNITQTSTEFWLQKSAVYTDTAWYFVKAKSGTQTSWSDIFPNILFSDIKIFVELVKLASDLRVEVDLRNQEKHASKRFVEFKIWNMRFSISFSNTFYFPACF